MTEEDQLEARVAKAGERYPLGVPVEPTTDHGYLLRGGLHPETANIANVLAHHGITVEGRPVDEALVFGVSGGPGAGYILWEFKAHDTKALVLGFRNQGQYPDRWTRKTLERLHVRYGAHSTGGAVGAARRLSQELAEGRPCIIRPDRYHLGYWRLPTHLDGHGGHDVVAYAEDDAGVHLDDRNVSPLVVPRAAVDAARARVGSYQNSLYAIDPATPTLSEGALREAVTAGLRECVAHLRAPSDSFSLPAWRKWARLVTDTRNAKAWPRVFADRRGLAGALLSVWEGALPVGMTGGNLRGLYAEFLDEAADLLGADGLRASAADFREAAARWEVVAEAALPASVPPFLEARALTSALRQAVADPASADPGEAEQAAADLWATRERLDRDFPLDEAAVRAQFESLAAALHAVFAGETAAVERLAAAIP